MKRALITGITGQDGSYLSELLLSKGYEVHGIVRRVALEDPHHRLSRIDHIKQNLHLHPGSLESISSIFRIVDKVKPDECYHLAAQSFVHESFEDGFTTMNINANGTHHLLSAILDKAPECRFYFAGSSEMFGKVESIPQTEKTRFHPRSPYGISKVTGFELTRNCREAYNLFACSGILFNHESPRRGYEFVTRKISDGFAKMKMGLGNILILGNLEAKRDWGFAGDYVKAMWSMLQQKTPDDYVISTNEAHTIKEFIDLASERAQIEYQIVDLHNISIEDANDKIGLLTKDKKRFFVVQHPQFYRPAEVDSLLGDSSKARDTFGWKPSVQFKDLVNMMVDNDINNYQYTSRQK